MNVTFTARRFRARPELKEHAFEAVKRLDRFYDGIVKVDVILSFEGAEKNIKVAEVNVHVYGNDLTAREKSDDFAKAIDAAVEKVVAQLSKYKSRLHAKDKRRVRAMQAKV